MWCALTAAPASRPRMAAAGNVVNRTPRLGIITGPQQSVMAFITTGPVTCGSIWRPAGGRWGAAQWAPAQAGGAAVVFGDELAQCRSGGGLVSAALVDRGVLQG